MKKTYMTVGQKERVRNRLLSRKFDPLTKANEAALEACADLILLRQLSPEDWARLEALPEGWAPRVSSVRLRDPDSSYKSSYDDVKLPSSRVVPASFMNRVFDEAGEGDELWTLRVELKRERERLKEERRVLERQIDTTLGAFRTVEAALEGWPEAADIVREVCGPGAPKTLPVVTTLNAALDLPPEEKQS